MLVWGTDWPPGQPPRTLHLMDIQFCPLCGRYWPGERKGRCEWSCWHHLEPLTNSPERVAAFLIGGKEAVELIKGAPSDVQFRHVVKPGVRGWASCQCEQCCNTHGYIR